MVWPLCMCGCLETTPRQKRTNRGVRKGVPAKRLPGHRSGRELPRPYLRLDPHTERERWAEKKRRRQAQKMGARCEPIRRERVWERDEGVCGICREAADPEDWHLDHRIPLARGGSHTYDNVQVSHPRCNQRKGARV